MVLDRYAYLICVLWQEGGTIRKTGEGNCGIMNANNETGVAARKRSLNCVLGLRSQRNHRGIMNAKEFTNDTEKIIKYLFASAAQC